MLAAMLRQEAARIAHETLSASATEIDHSRTHYSPLVEPRNVPEAGFFNIRILNELAHYLIDGGLALNSIPHISEEQHDP
jgi:hypothetical protein